MFKSFKVDNARRVEFTGNNIQIPKSKWAYLRNNIDTFHSTGGEGTPDNSIPLVNVSEWNKTVCGKNLFNLGVKTDYSNTYYNFDIVDNGLQIVVPYAIGSSAIFFRPEYLPIKNGYFTGKFTAESLSSMRCLIQLFDTDKNDITSTKTLTGWTYNVTYAAFYNDITAQGGYAYFNITDIDVKFIKIGFAFNDKIGLEYPVIARMYDIELNLGTPTSYQPYQGNTYPYRLEDVNGILHYGGDLPDGTADTVNWETGEFVEKVKKLIFGGSSDITGWMYYNLGYDDKCLVYYQDTANAWGSNLGYTLNAICTNAQIVLAETVNKIQVIKNTNNTAFYYIQTNTALGIVVEDTSAQKNAKAQAWIAAQISAHGNIEFMYELATPVTYKIKQYGETYGGVVWEYNEKPIQVESDMANVFTDKNVTMKFKAVSYGG